jgi:uncharacterized protein (DUF362 family)
MTEGGTIPGSSLVSLAAGGEGYPLKPPYAPGAPYAERPLGLEPLAAGVNPAYEGVRKALCLLRLDEEHYGQKDWNPLGGMIRPGDTVVLKPNFIRHFRETHIGHGDCLITHGSVIRAALDYVYLALRSEGRIIIADAPQDDADFDVIRKIAGLDAIQELYHRQAGFDVEVYDLRPERSRTVDGVTVGHEPLPGDPLGYVAVDLGPHSMFAEVEPLCHLLYGSEYDTQETRRHHLGGVHEYLISRTILEADCVISVPKLKTHKKTGITACMKNWVGVNGNKNWLPHHRLGTPAQGGDQFADNGLIHRVERGVMAGFRRVFPWLGPVRAVAAGPLKALGQRVFGDTNAATIRSGNWYGNDTTWRMVIDLNRVLMYADKNGCLQDAPARRAFYIVDGIVSGEGNGPLDAVPKAVGVIFAGTNPVAVDLACARMMGFDYMRLPMLRQALCSSPSPRLTAFGYDEVICRSNAGQFDHPLSEFDGAGMAFRPHFGWQGHVELHRLQVPQKCAAPQRGS